MRRRRRAHRQPLTEVVRADADRDQRRQHDWILACAAARRVRCVAALPRPRRSDQKTGDEDGDERERERSGTRMPGIERLRDWAYRVLSDLDDEVERESRSPVRSATPPFEVKAGARARSASRERSVKPAIARATPWSEAQPFGPGAEAGVMAWYIATSVFGVPR